MNLCVMHPVMFCVYDEDLKSGSLRSVLLCNFWNCTISGSFFLIARRNKPCYLVLLEFYEIAVTLDFFSLFDSGRCPIIQGVRHRAQSIES